MNSVTLTRHEFSFHRLVALAENEPRQWIRRRIKAVAAVMEGKLTREAIARKFHTDSDQIRIWIKRYNSQGLKGLEDESGRGRKSSLTVRQENSLKKALAKSPRKSGIPTNLWTGRAVQEYLKDKKWFYCSLPEAYVIIHRLGFSLQRPGREPIEADPAKEKLFLKELRGKKSSLSQCDLSGF